MLEVTRSFAVGRQVYGKGHLVDPKDPVVKGRESFFREARPAAERREEAIQRRHEGAHARALARKVAVERATAGPGEVRNVEIPKKESSDDTTCDVCGKSFKSSSGVATHKRAKHED